MHCCAVTECSILRFLWVSVGCALVETLILRACCFLGCFPLVRMFLGCCWWSRDPNRCHDRELRLTGTLVDCKCAFLALWHSSDCSTSVCCELRAPSQCIWGLKRACCGLLCMQTRIRPCEGSRRCSVLLTTPVVPAQMESMRISRKLCWFSYRDNSENAGSTGTPTPNPPRSPTAHHTIGR